MRIETLLNKVHPLKSFVYTACRFEDHKDRSVLVATIKPRKNGSSRKCDLCELISTDK